MPAQRRTDAATFGFGRFQVDAGRRSLLVDGAPAKLGPRAFDVLLALIERRHRIVGKNELLDLVWSGVIVEESNLYVQVSALRKLFGPGVIATIPGRGYRFTAVVDADRDSRPSSGLPGVPERAVRSRSPGDAPGATASEGGLPGNVPVIDQPLYGRDDAVRAVCRLLESSRLVTIVGAGGIGKSRVGLAVASMVRDRHPDGIWLVELAPLVDHAILPGSIAGVLGLQLNGTRAPGEELVSALESQRLMLILDNCEHMLEPANALARTLLARAPGVRLLVTSQEPLGMPGEQVFRLGTLAVPAVGDDTCADPLRAIDYGAVRLFVERVQSLGLGFRLDSRNTAAVVDICRKLDGLALAIEFAAARVPALGVQGVRDRLGERLHMLRTGTRAVPARHQTLRAALDWSHGLLDPQEQAVFRRLGVFRGDWSIEAAQRVVTDDGCDDWAALDTIGHLIDKSLVVVDAAESPRYRLLESARAYALEKLAEAQELAALSCRHASYFALYFERLADTLFSGAATEDEFAAGRAVEIDNLRGAMTWSLGGHGDAETALALLAHTAPYSFLLPLRHESEHWWDALLAKLGGSPLSARQAAMLAQAKIHWRMHRFRQPALESDVIDLEPLALRALDDPRRQALALSTLTIYAAWAGDLAQARAALDEFAALDPAALTPQLRAYALHASVATARMAGDAGSRAAQLADALAALREAGEGDGRMAFVVETDAAEDCLLQGRLDDAVGRFRALADMGRRQRRDDYRMSYVLMPLALALIELDRLDEAGQTIRDALPCLQRTAMWADYGPVLALFLARRGRHESAARMLGLGDAFLARAGGCHSLLDRRARQRTLLLLESIPRARVEAWIGVGASLSEEDVARLVISGEGGAPD